MSAAAILSVGLGAALGGIARYVIGVAFLQRFGPGFPWGTLFINVTGSFLIAVVAQLALTRTFGVPPALRLFMTTGILGGYTTFSTFSLDCLTLLGSGELAATTLYASLSVFGGIVAAYAGLVLTRLVTG